MVACLRCLFYNTELASTNPSEWKNLVQQCKQRIFREVKRSSTTVIPFCQYVMNIFFDCEDYCIHFRSSKVWCIEDNNSIINWRYHESKDWAGSNSSWFSTRDYVQCLFLSGDASSFRFMDISFEYNGRDSSIWEWISTEDSLLSGCIHNHSNTAISINTNTHEYGMDNDNDLM